MSREFVLQLLGQRMAEIRRRFEVTELALFGSAARDELRLGSDIDVLVHFRAPATFSQYMGLKFYLEELLGRSVDLVSAKGLRKEFKPHIERESLVVA
jgi:predicted nucleotidyltransferase